MLIEGIDLINHHIWYNTCRVIDGQESQLRHSWHIQSADLWTGSKSPETSCTTKRSNMFTFHFTQLGAGEPLHVETVKCIVTGVLSQQLLHLLRPLLLILERLVISSCLFHYEGCFLMCWTISWSSPKPKISQHRCRSSLLSSQNQLYWPSSDLY